MCGEDSGQMQAKCMMTIILLACLTGGGFLFPYSLVILNTAYFADPVKDFEAISGGCLVKEIFVRRQYDSDRHAGQDRGFEVGDGTNQKVCQDYYTYAFCAVEESSTTSSRRALVHGTLGPYLGTSLSKLGKDCHLSEPYPKIVGTSCGFYASGASDTTPAYSIDENVNCWRPKKGSTIKHELPYRCGANYAKYEGKRYGHKMPSDLSQECVKMYNPALDTDANWEIGLICLVIGSIMLFLPLSAIYIVAKENFCPDGIKMPWDGIKMPWDRKADATYVSNTEMGASDPGGASPNAV